MTRPRQPSWNESSPMTRLVLITGCSGGGKSTLLEALAERGHRVVEEPGRRIVAEELAGSGNALPWVDLAAFARRALAMARDDLDAAHPQREARAQAAGQEAYLAATETADPIAARA